jgi:hypothetical protein
MHNAFVEIKGHTQVVWSEVSVMPRLWVEKLRKFGSVPGRGKRYFFFTIASKQALRPTQPPSQGVPETPSQ